MKRILTVMTVLLIAAAFIYGCTQSTGEVAKQESRLDRVLKTGTLRVAVFGDLQPWGYRDDKGDPAGAEVELARAMADALKVKVEFVETTNANRIPFLLTDKVDVVMAQFSMNLERRTAIAFSNPYFRGGAILGVNKNNPESLAVKSYKDCAGKSVGVLKGSLNDQIATELIAPIAKEVLRFEDLSDLMRALEQNKVQAIVEDFVILVYNQKTKYPFVQSAGDAFSNDFIGIGSNREDQVWLNWIDGFVFEMLTSGKFAQILEKYELDSLPVNYEY